MEPTLGHGKICYLEIPAVDVGQSSEFYRDSFGWTLRTDDAGSVAFDDGVGQVSGMWVLDRQPMTEPGIIVSIMVDDAARVADLVVQNGGSIVVPVDPEAAEKLAWFRDPVGNLMGIYQQDNA